MLAELGGAPPAVILIGTGSEVALCVAVAETLAADGVPTRVVSMPSWELFEQQTADYRESVLPDAIDARVAVEQAASIAWERYVGRNGAVMAMHTFSASAPLKGLPTKFSFTSWHLRASRSHGMRGKGAEMAHEATVPNQTAQSVPPPIPAGPCAMVIFGAGGDLTKRLVVPALYNLAAGKLLPQSFALIGVDIADLTNEQWRQHLTDMLHSFARDGGEFDAAAIDADVWGGLTGRMTYLRGDFADGGTFTRLAGLLAQIERERGTGGNVLFYLAIADRFFGPVTQRLAAAGLAGQQEGARWRRLIVEKPFGHDLASATALNARLLKLLSEDQIYRIDHFLGKEAVQSIMAVRFANGFFEPVWNRNHIEHVQITVAETVGVEKRGRFYEQTGALRDMVPNHVFQLLAMTAMEPPSSFDPDAVRNRKADVLNAIPPVKLDCAVRGQYGKGVVQGQPVTDYRSEPDVAPDSFIETYVALKLEIDTWRWASVPFYLRTGKVMSQRWTEIAIRFRQAPLSVFQNTDVTQLLPNWLVLQIQPDEGISFQFQVKRPGQSIALAPVKASFAYDDWFPRQANVGYETLIYDCMIGDATLFQRADMVEAGWRIVQPVLDGWSSEQPRNFPNYAAGSAGPAAADEMLVASRHAWRPIGNHV